MATKKLKPITPGSRHRVAPRYDEISKVKPAGKKFIKGKKRTGGRNCYGRITARGRGGGHKRRYRFIDFRRDKHDIPARVQTIEYDPNRSAHIALLAYRDGEKRYIIAPNKLKVDDVVISGERVEPNVGNATQLRNMPTGTIIHNIELYPGRGAQLCRTAGASAQLLAKTEKYVTIALPSDEVRMVQSICMATVGSVSNPDHFNTSLGKAGRSRWKGKRPLSRGVAKNPVDHPMGGGEGKASGGHPRSPWGLSSKGKKTRKRKKLSNRYIIRRKKKSK